MTEGVRARSLSVPSGLDLPRDVQPPLQRRHSDMQLKVSDQGRKQIDKQIGKDFGKAALNFARDQYDKAGLKPTTRQGYVNFMRAEASKARDAAMGLSRGDAGLDLGRAVGKDKYVKGERVGQNESYITLKQKDVGRDPGQLAYLSPFRDQRFAHLAPATLLASYNSTATDQASVARKQEAVTITTDYMKSLEGKADGDPKLKAKLDKAWSAAHKENLANGKNPATPTRQEYMKQYYNGLDKAGRREFLTFAALRHAANVDPKYGEVHMLKGDYAEKDRSTFGKFVHWLTGKSGEVRISSQLASGKYSNPIMAGIYRFGAGASKKDANAGVVKEALATDIMRQLGRAGGQSNYVTQEVRIANAQWKGGSPKLVLDITFVNQQQTKAEFNDQALDPKASYKDFDGSIVDGRLVNKRLDPQSGDYVDLTDKVKIKKETGAPIDQNKRTIRYPTGQDGKPITPPFKEGTQVEGLGRAKAKMLVMGDRDGLGGTGANKGHVGKHMAAIDPGHSFETGQHEINDDFSFKHPGNSDNYQTKLKNFDIFDHAPLSEKMRGIKDMQDLHKSGVDMAVFDQYAEEYGSKQENRLNFSDDIQEWRDNYTAKKEYMLGKGEPGTQGHVKGVFSDRLAVYEMGLTTQQEDDVFDVMDNLEKLTSTADWRSDNGLVELERPRITKDENGNFQRVKWEVTKNQDGTLTLSAPKSQGAVDKINAFIQRGRDEDQQLGDDRDVFDTSDPQTIKITLTPAGLANLKQVFSDDAIKQEVMDRT